MTLKTGPSKRWIAGIIFISVHGLLLKFERSACFTITIHKKYLMNYEDQIINNYDPIRWREKCSTESLLYPGHTGSTGNLQRDWLDNSEVTLESWENSHMTFNFYHSS